MDIEHLQFPIGRFAAPSNYTSEFIKTCIDEIEAFPTLLKELTKDLNSALLNLTYRPNGWKVKQVVHHCADSHMNSFIRFKLALTENQPTIKPYFEERWAELTDSLENNIEDSILLLSALHRKWVILLRSLTEEQLDLEFIHPEHGKKISLKENIATYAWHGKHHLEHIKIALSK